MSKLLSAFKENAVPDFGAMIENAFRKAAIADSQGYVAIKKERNDGIYFSPSSLGKCLREVYYNMVNALDDVPDEAKVDTKFWRICRNGQMMHQRYQDPLFQQGRLAGGYTCRKCGVIHEEIGVCPKACPDCGAGVSALCYREARFNDHENRVRFKPDGWLVRWPKSGKVRLYYTDFKSMNTYKFKSLIKTGVPREHMQQLNFYMCHRPVIKFEDALMRVQPIGVMVYEDKNTQEQLCLTVDKDQEQYEADMENIKYLHKCIEKGRPPKRVADANMCKWCAHVEECKK